MYKTWIVWEGESSTEYSFRTQDELEAFRFGIREANDRHFGFYGFEEFRSKQDAIDYVDACVSK